MKKLFCILLAAALVAWPRRAVAQDEPHTRQASFVVHLSAPADEAFPMFDPVHETKWAPEWKPRMLGNSVHEGLVFLVGSGMKRATWVIDRYDPARHEIAYLVVSSTAVTKIHISVAALEQHRSVAKVTYTRTATDARELAALEHFVTHVASQGPEWETAINRALQGVQRH